MFATDRDLILLEPNLFRDAAWIGQRLVSGTTSVAGSTLTLGITATNLEDAHIGPGHIAVVDGVPLEVLERLSQTEASVSRIRALRTDPPIKPAGASDRPFAIHTFAHQLAITHGQILRMIGIELDDPHEPGRPTEADITNPNSLRLLESLGALHLVFAAASATSDPDSALARRAELYKRRFNAERQRAAARLDLNGDGLPDATRRLNAIQFVRG